MKIANTIAKLPTINQPIKELPDKGFIGKNPIQKQPPTVIIPETGEELPLAAGRHLKPRKNPDIVYLGNTDVSNLLKVTYNK